MENKYEIAHKAILRKAAEIANRSPDRPLRLMVSEPFIEASLQVSSGLALEVERHAWEICDRKDRATLTRIAVDAIYDAITSDDNVELFDQTYTYRDLFAGLIVEAAREGRDYFEEFRNAFAQSDQGELFDGRPT